MNDEKVIVLLIQKIVNKLSYKYTFIICTILFFMFTFIGMVLYQYYHQPPIKNQLIITDNNGNVIDESKIKISIEEGEN